MTAAARAPKPTAPWLAAGAAAAAGGVAGFTPRPAGLPGDAFTTSVFAAFAAAAIVALSILPFVVRRSVRSRLTWIVVSATALGLGLLSYAGGGYAQRSCMARYAGQPVVIGTELTPLGAAYSRENPELSRDEWLFDSAGVVDRVWTRASIDRCRVAIASTYFLWIPFLVVSVLSAVQAVPAPTLPAGSRTGAVR